MTFGGCNVSNIEGPLTRWNIYFFTHEGRGKAAQLVRLSFICPKYDKRHALLRCLHFGDKHGDQAIDDHLWTLWLDTDILSQWFLVKLLPCQGDPRAPSYHMVLEVTGCIPVTALQLGAQSPSSSKWTKIMVTFLLE